MILVRCFQKVQKKGVTNWEGDDGDQEHAQQGGPEELEVSLVLGDLLEPIHHDRRHVRVVLPAAAEISELLCPPPTMWKRRKNILHVYRNSEDVSNKGMFRT